MERQQKQESPRGHRTPCQLLPIIALATETEKVVSETLEEMKIEFGKQIGERVVSETSSSSSAQAAHASAVIPVEEIFCDAKIQHVEHATDARENIQQLLLLSALSKIQQMPSFTATISSLLTEYRYEIYTSARERMDMMQQFKIEVIVRKLIY